MKKSLVFTWTAAIACLLGGLPFYAAEINAVSKEEVKSLAERIKETRAFVAQLTKGNKQVLNELDQLLVLLQKPSDEGQPWNEQAVDKILKGIEFAADKHKEQTRKNGERTPYIIHPIGVTVHLIESGKVRDSAIIIGALLHDTVEDTEATLGEIEETFGKEVAAYVGEVTDDQKLSRAEKKRRQVINAAHKSAGAAQIKMADKLYNLTELLRSPPPDWSRARIDEYYEWSQSVIDRLPSANPELKKSLETVINRYWERDSAS